jgi:HAD superfamily hydrolase (TIGR01509 family)
MHINENIQAVIFDMDGLLIDSEPLWGQAMVDGFSLVGFEFGPHEFREVQGMRIDLIVDYWYEKRPWSGYTSKELTDLILDRVTLLIEEQGQALDGAHAAIEFFRRRHIPLAVASSSPCRIINSNIKALGAEGCFDVICSAEDEVYGKPHPAVYIRAAELLGVQRRNCLVFEDSVLGLIAAKAAEMTCICVPDEEVAGDKRLGIADYVLSSLKDFDEPVLKRITPK